jgi:hypothetical protein
MSGQNIIDITQSALIFLLALNIYWLIKGEK